MFPDILYEGFTTNNLVILTLIVVLVIEGFRLRSKTVLYGMRPYEKNQLSAVAWFSIGMVPALLFFPMRFVIPCVIGMTLIDPLIWVVKARASHLHPFLPLVGHATILLLSLYWFAGVTLALPMVILLSAVGAPVAIVAEGWEFPQVDDDFLMVMVPLVVLTILEATTLFLF